ncbi:GTP-binding protein [Neiella sp. HB171785]|uniref:GTP-binding protein n=1 Tax=Neiella litorisoli TaxID=2771431 RepID=A0A8J6QUP4_9GAMM|nr:GTP-binding protein [Neiella litorisoli]MBD1389308.1 GTP-binding protein [Neiella litorisoli]
MTCKFILVTGFLGSGKTSLVKHMLSDWGESARVAVIQNEFAASGVDGKELKLANDQFELIEINNGSVFCVCLLGHFIHTLERLLDEYQPDYIVLEASGLADPINIVELLQADELSERLVLDQIITLVDAANIERSLAMLARTRHQIMIADVVLLNKQDCYPGDLTELSRLLRSMNPHAAIYPTEHGRICLSQLTESSHLAAGQYYGRQSADRPEQLSACVVRVHQRFTQENLNALLAELQHDCIRIKGFVQTPEDVTLSFHSVFENCQVAAVSSYSGAAELIAFSETLTSKQVRQIVRRYAS